MKNINFKKYTTTLLTACAVIFGLTTLATAAVKPDLISRTANGSGGNGSSQNFSASADGRYIVFQSDAANLVSGITDTNNSSDIFLRDTQTGTIRCLSCVSAANPTSTGNNLSANPIITPDGRYVVFVSKASDLLGGIDINNDLDVFRFDTQANERVLVSATQSGVVTGNSYSGIAVNGRGYDISDDGRYITFVSNASDLTGIADTNNKSDIFIRDMQTSLTRFISRSNTTGNAGNNDSFDPSMSADGQYVAFTSLASDLISNDGNVNYDVFVFDVQAQLIRCASMSTRTDIVTTGSSGSVTAVISKDGSRVAYFTFANDITNVPIPFGNPYTNIVVYDLGFRQNSLVTVNVAGNASGNNESGIGNNPQKNVSISANGRYVTFESRAGNLSPLTTSPGTYNVFRRDLARGLTEVVSVVPSGAAATQNTFVGLKNNAMSSDGRFVTFYSSFNNFTSDFPVTGGTQVYVRDMLNGVTTVLTLNNVGTALSTIGGNAPRITANGKAVVFDSAATDLTPQTTNNFNNIFKASVPTPQKSVSDFDGDGKTDFAVWRPNTGYWYVLPNTNVYTASTLLWGVTGDKIVPADYTGDSRTDYAVFRPSNGTWYITDTANFNTQSTQFGTSGDVPLPADYDGDGKADLAVYRPSNGTWYTSTNAAINFGAVVFGAATDKPVPADYDGDGKADIAVFRPSNGTWYYIQSSNRQIRAVQFGQNGDVPVAADYDGDGKTDLAVYRSGVWYILRSLTGQVQSVTFGAATDIPVPGSYDGDGKADIGVFRPSSGAWYYVQSSDNQFRGLQFGQNGDAPVPAAFIQ